MGSLGSVACLVVLLVLAGAGRLVASLEPNAEPLAVLIMGIDRRAGEIGPSRSDTMILAGLNTQTGQAVLLAIPRDLWVSIPGVGQQRINSALVLGHDLQDAAAGSRLAVATVEHTLGLPVHRYVLLDFQAFVRLVDTLGGIEVDVPEPITDTQYPTPDYGVTTVHFEPGPQVLDGEQALVYVRTRHDDSDFGRSRRQQQVIQAMATRLADPATWIRIAQVGDELRTGLGTDLVLRDWPVLWRLLQAVARGDVTMATLDGEFSRPWTTAGGAWVLLPNQPAVDALISTLFGSQ